MKSFKNLFRLLLLFIMASFFWECQQDDICAQEQQTTPALVIQFSDDLQLVQLSSSLNVQDTTLTQTTIVDSTNTTTTISHNILVQDQIILDSLDSKSIDQIYYTPLLLEKEVLLESDTLPNLMLSSSYPSSSLTLSAFGQDKITLPLRVDRDREYWLFSTDPDLEDNHNILELTYDPELVYISRACGYSMFYKNLQARFIEKPIVFVDNSIDSTDSSTDTTDSSVSNINQITPVFIDDIRIGEQDIIVTDQDNPNLYLFH